MSLEAVLVVAAALFGIGVYGALSQQSFVMLMMGLEMMINASILALGAFWSLTAGGNPQGQNAGVFSVAHENAYNRMAAGSRGLPALTGDALPESTFFTARKDLFSNGEAVQLHAQPSAHSDGDLIVFFRESDVVVTGDVFVTTSYPVIDVSRGGSVQGVIDALNTIIELTVPERNQMGGTRVVPGHGRICNEADVVEYRDMVTIIRDRVRDMAQKGMTAQQVKAARPSLEYDGIYGATSGEWTTDMFLDVVFREVGARK